MAGDIKRLKLSGLGNTRDLGGIPVAGGGIAYGKLIRSGHLFKLRKSTVKKLEEMCVKTVIDFRTEQEASEKPDTALRGATYINLSLLSAGALGVTFEQNTERSLKELGDEILKKYSSPDEYMERIYDGILFEKQSLENLATALNILVETDGCVLFHCTGGKDRAGVFAMLIESLLGLDEETILLDYAATGEFQKRRNRLVRLFSALMPFSRNANKLLLELLKTNPKHIETAISKLKANYGSVTDYCKSALGVTDDDIAVLKKKYLVD